MECRGRVRDFRSDASFAVVARASASLEPFRES